MLTLLVDARLRRESFDAWAGGRPPADSTGGNGGPAGWRAGLAA
jgi:hypothetical protein